MKVLFFDTETGGTDPKKHSLLSVGACVLDLDTGEIEDKFECFVKLDSVDDYVITEGAFKVHGITAEYCMEHGVSIEEIRDRMFDMWVGCEVVGGHNVQFDIGFTEEHMLEGEAFRDHFGYRVLDSFPAVLLLAGSVQASGQTLSQAVKAFKIDMSDIRGKFHGALFDAIASARVSYHMRRLLVYAREQERSGSLSV